jgi:rfaE bifunctional protein nucleotidyltransferase chain/domain
MQAEDLRLVLTNGCFDLLHVGHVRYLRQARALGDALAVGLNSDRSARRLKGPSRPVVNEDERAEMLSALESVDYVVIFDEDTAEGLVDEIRPAVYVKGGDYSTDPADARFPPEGHVVSAYGGSVHVVPYVPGRSTTELIERLCAGKCDPG